MSAPKNAGKLTGIKHKVPVNDWLELNKLTYEKDTTNIRQQTRSKQAKR